MRRSLHPPLPFPRYEKVEDSWLFQEFCGESGLITEDQLKECLGLSIIQSESEVTSRLFRAESVNVGGENVTMWRTPYTISERYADKP